MRVLKWHALALAALLVMTGNSWAQDTDTSQDEASEQEAKLSPAERVKKVGDDYQKGYQELIGKIRKIRDRQEQQEAIKELATFQDEHGKKILAVAEELKGTPDAIKALTLLFYPISPIGSRDASIADTAKKQLLRDHVNDDEFVPVMLIFATDKEFVKTAGETTGNHQVKGLALFNEMSAAKGRELNQANEAKVLPLMKLIQKEYGDVEVIHPDGSKLGALAEFVEREIFAYENLRVGKVAPNITGTDIDDVKFELKDYRGKVVVLDFWGDW